MPADTSIRLWAPYVSTIAKFIFFFYIFSFRSRSCWAEEKRTASQVNERSRFCQRIKSCNFSHKTDGPKAGATWGGGDKAIGCWALRRNRNGVVPQHSKMSHPWSIAARSPRPFSRPFHSQTARSFSTTRPSLALFSASFSPGVPRGSGRQAAPRPLLSPAFRLQF